ATDLAALDAAAEQMHLEHDTQREKVESLGGLLDQHKTTHEKVLDEERQLQSALNEARSQLQTARGRQSSLEALQHAALGQEENAASQWLARLGLDKSPRLGEALQVEAGWETAVETVLSGFIDSVLVAESLDEAHQRVSGLSALAPYQSVITRGGEWLGPGWARVRRAQGNQVGVLAREREIRTLTEQVAALEARIEECTSQLDDLRTRKFEAERARDDTQRELYNAHRRQSELAGQLQSHRGKLETARARGEKVAGELATLIEQLDELQTQT